MWAATAAGRPRRADRAGRWRPDRAGRPDGLHPDPRPSRRRDRRRSRHHRAAASCSAWQVPPTSCRRHAPRGAGSRPRHRSSARTGITSRQQHLGVVDHDEVARLQQVGQIPNMTVLDVVASVDEQTGGVTRLDRLLRDALGREIVVDVGERLGTICHVVEGTSLGWNQARFILLSEHMFVWMGRCSQRCTRNSTRADSRRCPRPELRQRRAHYSPGRNPRCATSTGCDGGDRCLGR